MAKLTQHDLIVANLKALGFEVQVGASSRYTVLHKEGSSAGWFWVGKNGAIRYNGVKRLDGAIPAGKRTRDRLLQPLTK